MEGQKFLLVQDSIRNYQEATAIALMTLNESLQTLQQKIQAFTDLESFQGKTATAAKTYFSEIYTNLLAGMQECMISYMNNSALYSDQFTGIDGDPHARLPEETMDLMNSHIRQCFGNMDGLVDLVNGQLAGVSDIVSIPAVDTNDLAEAYQEVIDYVQGKEEDIAEADEEMLHGPLSDTERMIQTTNGMILELLGRENVVTGYQSGDIIHIPGVEEFAQSMQNCMDYQQEHGEEIRLAWERQQQIITDLHAKEREKQGKWEILIGAGSLVVLGIGAAATVLTCGAAAPMEAAMAVTLGSSLLAVDNVATIGEGIQDVYYGSKGDITTNSFHFIRDGIFQGNETAYAVYGTVSQFVSLFTMAHTATGALGKSALSSTISIAAQKGLDHTKLPEPLKFGASIAVDLLVSHKLMGKTAGTKVSSSGTKATTIDYSYKFDKELVNFNDGFEIKTTIDKNLILVQYSSDAPDASLCYWTTIDEANGISTVNEYMDKLALSKDWGNRNTVKVARIPAGTQVKYAVGTAKEQLLIADPRPGGGVQYLFNEFDSNWITEVRTITN